MFSECNRPWVVNAKDRITLRHFDPNQGADASPPSFNGFQWRGLLKSSSFAPINLSRIRNGIVSPSSPKGAIKSRPRDFIVPFSGRKRDTSCPLKVGIRKSSNTRLERRRTYTGGVFFSLMEEGLGEHFPWQGKDLAKEDEWTAVSACSSLGAGRNRRGRCDFRFADGWVRCKNPRVLS